MMTIFAGAHRADDHHNFWGNLASISFKVLEGGDAEDATAFVAVKPSLLALVSAWEPHRASADSTRYGELQSGTGDTTPFVHGTWVAYFAPKAAELPLTPLGVAHRLRDGARLWCASDAAFDLDNPDHLRAASAMHAALSRK